MLPRRYQDLATGEIKLVAVANRRRHRDQFVALFQDWWMHLLTTEGRPLSALHLKIVLYLVARAAYENTVDLSIQELADALGYDRSSVSRAMPDLEAYDLIQRDAPQGSRPRRIRLNPHAVFKGLPSQRDRVVAIWAGSADDTGQPNDPAAAGSSTTDAAN